MAREKQKNIKFDIDQMLFQRRQLFLYDEVCSETVEELIKSIITLDAMKVAPIVLHINSPGGSVTDGFALIDTILTVQSPIITVISGEAASMAGMISVVGNMRYMTENSVWMAHDMAGGICGDYTTKVTDRAAFLKRIQEQSNIFMAKHTKLTPQDLLAAQHGELWLSPKECLEKGIIEDIIPNATINRSHKCTETKSKRSKK